MLDGYSQLLLTTMVTFFHRVPEEFCIYVYLFIYKLFKMRFVKSYLSTILLAMRFSVIDR